MCIYSIRNCNNILNFSDAIRLVPIWVTYKRCRRRESEQVYDFARGSMHCLEIMGHSWRTNAFRRPFLRKHSRHLFQRRCTPTVVGCAPEFACSLKLSFNACAIVFRKRILTILFCFVFSGFYYCKTRKTL